MRENINYALGLDIGIASVGWSVINLDVKRIEDLGVRIFNAAENPKDGSSLAAPRRIARGRRRLLRRKAYRVNRVRKMIVENNILTRTELNSLFDSIEESIWELRVRALDEKLDNKQWARILINLCKRRGFKSNRKNEANDKEMGQIISSIKENEEEMDKIGARTIGEYLYKKSKGSDNNYEAVRNKFGVYKNCVARQDIRQEIHSLFECQRRYGNEFATNAIEDIYLNIFNSQRPYSNFEALEKMVGFCTFERKNGLRRAPKSCISAEEFVLYESMNKLSLLKDGDKRKLNEDERNIIVNEAFNKKEIKYSALRKLLKLPDDVRFSTLTYNGDSLSKTENTKFVSMSGYYEIKKAIEHGVSKEYFQSINDNRKMMNDIAYVLSLAKTDDEIVKQMRIRNIPEEIIQNVMDISFSKFVNLSIKAIDKILPYLKQGYMYNEACEKAGYDFKAIYKGEKTYKLPVIDIEEIVNPVVIRSLAQTRKVINAVIEKYGSPVRINIELARDLAKSFKDRKQIEKEQKENRANVDKIRDQLRELMEKEPTGAEVLKYRLWQQQKGECAYSQEMIPLDNLFSPGYCEIDHILPFSRSFDDSLSNKVLVRGFENQRKGNRTPYEYFGSDEERWHRFDIWVNESNLPYKKKSNLLKKKYGKEEQAEWKLRNLNDTKYICSYIANFISNRLIFKESNLKRTVYTINGRATSYLRAKWGLIKVREDGDKHHALDATVIAVTTQGMIQEISKYSKADELKYVREGDHFIDIETGEIYKIKDYSPLLKDKLPRPWLGFSEELKMRLSDDPVSEVRKSPINTYDEEFISKRVKPIFVSRMPFRKVSGKLFKETVYSHKSFTDEGYVVKKNLQDLTESDFDHIYNYASDTKLYEALYSRFIEFGKNSKKAFEEEFRKPTKSGKLGPVVRSIKVISKAPFKKDDAIDINEGLVGKEGMVRIDIYCKAGKYYAVPVYRYQLLRNEIPKRAALAAKTEKEWPIMDDSYDFKFSIFKNDLIEIKYTNKGGYFGYYDGFDRSTASIIIESHDSSKRFRGIGIKSNVACFNKYEVDVLGCYHKVKDGSKK